MNVIECINLSKHYRKNKAISNLSFQVKENTITGLIGRNGAGKTTLLKIIAGFQKQTSGDVFIFGEKPFNNLNVSQNMIFIDDQMILPPALTLKETLETVCHFYPNWDHNLATKLFEYFAFDPNQYHQKLSKGMKSTFNMIIGLAAHCPLTIFDEPTTGMDAAVRKDFYRALLKDYLAKPRTIILSSHLLNEMEDLLEDVLLIKNGKKQLHISVEQLKQYAIAFSGKKELIKEFIDNKAIFYEKTIGTDTSYIVVENNFNELILDKAKQAGIQLSQVAAEDLCVYLSNSKKGVIDDVFNNN